MIRKILVFLLVVCGAPQVGAQSALALRVLPWDDELAARKLSLVAGETGVEIHDMHPHKRCGPFRLRLVDGSLRVRALDREPDAEGRQPEVSFKVPANLGHPLLLLLPDEDHPTGLRPMILNDNPESFRWGTYRFLNATARQVVVQLEERAVRVPAGWKPTDLMLRGEARGIGARIAFEESIAQPLYSAVWEHDPEMRTLVIMVTSDDPRLGPLAIKAVPEDRLIFEGDLRSLRESQGSGAGG